MISYASARNLIVEDWRRWATARGLDPNRPTEADFFEFQRYLKHEREDAFAALRRGGGDWIDLIMALAYHGLVVNRDLFRGLEPNRCGLGARAGVAEYQLLVQLQRQMRCRECDATAA